MTKTGKNPKFTNEELQILGMVVSKLSARLAHVMDKYPPNRFLKIALNKSNSRRSRITIKLILNEFAKNQKSRNNNGDKQDLRQLLREISKSTIFDETSLVSSWGNKGKGFSSKEETTILKSLAERGIAENIIGKKKIDESTNIKLMENGGFPSVFQWSRESQRIFQILSGKKAVEFIINSLYNSELLFHLYWYLLSSYFYLIRDCSEPEIKQLIEFGKNLSPNYQDLILIKDIPQLKLLFANFNDQKLLELAKRITRQLMKTDLVNAKIELILFIALFKLNRGLD